MVSKNRILVAVPSADLMQARFVNSLIALLGRIIPDTTFFYANYISSRITENRNSLVQIMLDNNHTHILFMDADMVVPLDGIERLLSHDKDIVGSSACKRLEGNPEVIGIPLDQNDSTTTIPQKELVEMLCMGLPFMLIKREVFEKLPKPWFAEPANEGGFVVAEDSYFCMNAREAGYQIWCDMPLTACMGHLGVKEYKAQPIETPKLRSVA